jgi:F-type H+-transporting ATPase subunit alpha
LRQPQYQPIPAPEQIAALFAVTQGLFDSVPLHEVAAAEEALRRSVREQLPDVTRHIMAGRALYAKDRDELMAATFQALEPYLTRGQDADD